MEKSKMLILERKKKEEKTVPTKEHIDLKKEKRTK